MTLKFGTDGIRGVANEELTPELSLALGQSAALVLGEAGKGFLVGRDTRKSGPLLQAALSAGLASAGSDVIDVSVLPTPGVAYLGALRGFPSAVISASHNGFADNGIKFFTSDGRKLDDDIEDRIENGALDILHGSVVPSRPRAGAVGVISREHEVGRSYGDFLVSTLGDESLKGVHVVLDCAHGAASHIAPEVFRVAGARVTVINDQPNGLNINDGCGSTFPSALCQVVVERSADVGLAFDGDADRVLAADATGKLIDGDEIMGMLAIDGKQRGTLKDDTLVVTLMSNLGLKLSMERHGIKVHEVAVGDRNVLQALSQYGWSLGGEQSGHVILPQLATTGDGILTGLQIASLMQRNGELLSALATESMTRLPQVLKNVRVDNGESLVSSSAVQDALRVAEAELQGEGRVLLRASGTEPLVRVMVEATTEDQANAIADRLCAIVSHEFGTE